MFPADSRRFDPKWEVRRVGVARGVLSALPSSRVSSKAQNRMGTIPQKRYINRTIELRMTARIFKIPAGDVREHEGLFVSRLQFTQKRTQGPSDSIRLPGERRQSSAIESSHLIRATDSGFTVMGHLFFPKSWQTDVATGWLIRQEK